MGEAQRMVLAAAQEDYESAIERRKPSFMYKPRLSVDGNQWCALYGENLQDGVAGFGDSPELAYMDFNRAWCEKLLDGTVEAKTPRKPDALQNDLPQ